jgi:hypothetical protein
MLSCQASLVPTLLRFVYSVLLLPFSVEAPHVLLYLCFQVVTSAASASS